MPDERQQVGLGNGVYAGDPFPRGGAVHGVDGIAPLAALQIALVHGVDTEKPGRASGTVARRTPMVTPWTGRILGQQHTRGALAGTRRRWYRSPTESFAKANSTVAIARERAPQHAAGGGASSACPWRDPPRPARRHRLACTCCEGVRRSAGALKASVAAAQPRGTHRVPWARL